MIFDVFKYTPLDRLVAYLLVGLSTIGHFIFLVKYKMFSKSIKNWYYIGIIAMIISMVSATLIYGQSLFSGLIANSHFFNIGSIILFLYVFLKRNVSFSNVIPTLNTMAWISASVIVLMVIIDFEIINQSELTGNVVIVNAGKISKNLTNFFGVYWLSVFLYKSHYKYLLYSIWFFAVNHFYDIQRFVFLVDLFVIGVAVLKMRKTKASKKFILPVFFSFFFVGIFITFSSTGNAIFERFVQASKIISQSGDSIDDSSTAIRIFEIDLALNKFVQHPLFGNGFYRGSEAYKVIGQDVHFYVSDIGVFGILFSLGIFGFFLFLKQLKLAWTLIRVDKYTHYQLCFSLVLIFVMLNSILTGFSINNYFYFFYILALSEVLIYSTKKLK